MFMGVFMRNLKKEMTIFIILLFIVLFSVNFFFVASCKDSFQPSFEQQDTELENTIDGDTRLVVVIHDTPFKKDDKTVEKLNINIIEMVIINQNDQHITILDEKRSMDILAVSRNDPVVLSNVSVEPGTYKELRLILEDNSTIQVDGETFPIKIPSGSQSGLKLKGPFEIPKGKLFRLTIDFIANESVHYNKGQGYMLKPVLQISSTAEITGIFRGYLSISNSIGVCETIVQLNSDNSARLKISNYPNYTLYADYNYNSSKKEIRMTNTSLSAPGLKKRELKEVMKRMPSTIILPVKQWSLDSIIAIDTGGLVCDMYRVDEFNFSLGTSFTEFTLNIEYPDASKSGKDVITEIMFIDTGMPPITLINEFEGNRITENVHVLNSYIKGSSTRIQITSYLFDDPSNMNIDTGYYASMPAILMVDSVFSESSENPWQKASVFTLVRDSNNQIFTVTFPKKLNIRIEHNNFTNNNPVVSWDSYVGANNGYFVLVLVEDKEIIPPVSGDNFFAIAYHEYTKETKVTVRSNRVKFTPVNSPLNQIPPSIITGDIIRIEVFVLDSTGSLNTRTRQGALLFDTLTIKR
jgi:hypothetical protein